MPNPVGIWFEKDGAQCYQNGRNDVTKINSLLTVDKTGVDWSKTKYISVVVETIGKAKVGFSGDVPGDGWTDSDHLFVDNDKVTIYWNTNGMEINDLYVSLWDYDESKVVLSASQLLKVSEIEFHETYDGLYNTWYKDGDSWCYQNGSSNATSFDNLLPIDMSSVTDWSEIKYVSADIETTGKANAALAGNLETQNNWNSGESVNIDNEKVTLYWQTNGKEPTNPKLTFWWYNNKNEIAAGANDLITVKFTLSTQARTIYDKWYEASDGVWKYVDSGDGYQDGDSNYPLVFNDYMDIDLTGAKYVSAKVTVDGMAVTGFNGNNDNGTHHKGGSYVENVDRENTSYFFCYEGGYTSLSYGLWNIGKGTTITLSDLKASTTDLTNYTDITGQVVQIGENSYYFKNLGQTSENIGSDLQLLPDDVDISAVQTISMKIKGIRSGTGINSGGWTAENRLVQGYPFPTINGEYVVERKYRGWIARSPILSVYTDKYDEVYISDIIFDKTPIETVYTNPNAVLIYDNVTVITHEDISHRIELVDLSKMEVPGTLKVKVELIDGYDDPYIQPNFQD